MRRVDMKPDDIFDEMVPTDEAMEVIKKNQTPDNLDKWKGFDFDGPLLSGRKLKKT